MPTGNKKKAISRKGLILRLILLVSYLLIYIYFYYLISEFEFNPFIISLVLFFVFLMTLGPFFLRKRRRSLYSRMFPKRKRKPVQEKERRKRRLILKKEPKPIQPKIYQAIDFEFEYRKPIITNCENCGNILPSFVKNKCPFCQEQV